jgi:hypothetical protein
MAAARCRSLFMMEKVEKKEWRSENKLWWLKKSIIPFALQSIAMTLMSVLTVSLRTLMGYG